MFSFLNLFKKKKKNVGHQDPEELDFLLLIFHLVKRKHTVMKISIVVLSKTQGKTLFKIQTSN